MHRQLQLGAEYRIVEILRGELWLPSQQVRIMAQLPDSDLPRAFIRAEVLILTGSHSGERLSISAKLERLHKKETCDCAGLVYRHRRGSRNCKWREDALCYCAQCGESATAEEFPRPQPGQPKRTEWRSHCHDSEVFADADLTQPYEPWRTS